MPDETTAQTPHAGEDSGTPHALTPADAAALDALIGAKGDRSRVSGVDRERAEKISHLLTLAASARVSPDPIRVDATLARIALAKRAAGEPALSAQDESALEAYVHAGYDDTRVVHAFQPRAKRLDAMRKAITGAQVHASPDLVDRTMAAVASAENDQRGRMNIELQRASRGTGVRLADLVSVAAVLLIAASVVWPVLAGMREQSRRAMCNANLGSSAVAFANYAEDSRGMLPVVTAGLSDETPWWNVGANERRSNSANLFELVRAGYTTLEDLACPGNPDAPRDGLENAGDWQSLDQVSYSYRIMAGRQVPVWRHETTTLVLADHSPIIKKAIEQRVFDPMANSENHDEAGQHVLFADGSTRWLRRPVLDVPGHDADMIWLPRQIEVYIRTASGARPSLKGSELPAGVDDAFVGP